MPRGGWRRCPFSPWLRARVGPVFPVAFQGKTHAVKNAAADKQLLIVPEWSLK